MQTYTSPHNIKDIEKLEKVSNKPHVKFMIYAKKVYIIRSTIPSFSGDTKVCKFWIGKKVIDISSNEVCSQI